MRIGSVINSDKLLKSKFFILCGVVFLVRLQEKFDIDHSKSGCTLATTEKSRLLLPNRVHSSVDNQTAGADHFHGQMAEPGSRTIGQGRAIPPDKATPNPPPPSPDEAWPHQTAPPPPPPTRQGLATPRWNKTDRALFRIPDVMKTDRRGRAIFPPKYYSVHSAIGSRMNGIAFRSFRHGNTKLHPSSQVNENNDAVAANIYLPFPVGVDSLNVSVR